MFTFIIGISSMVIPLPVSEATLEWDYWWMLGINLVLLPMLLLGKVGRAAGAVLLICLVTYVVVVLYADQTDEVSIATDDSMQTGIDLESDTEQVPPLSIEPTERQ